MNNDFQANLIRALEEMNVNQSALSFIEDAKQSNPLQLFLILSQLILNESMSTNIVSSCIVLMSSILRPTIAHPLNQLTNEFQAFDPASYDSIKQSLFRCLTFPTQCIRLSAARCIGFLAKIEIPRRKWQNVFDQLELLVNDTQNFGEWAPIGAVSSMGEIISEVKFRPRWPIFKSAQSIITNSFFSIMSKDIDPELKIEAIKCLQKAIPVFIQVDQSESQLYQKILEIIISHIQIDNYQFHQQLYTLLTIFLIRIRKILTMEIVSHIFTSILPDIASNNETKQLHVILLCKEIAKDEQKIIQKGLEEPQFFITEALELSFNRVFLKIIANGDFSDINEADSVWATPYAARDTLITFGNVFPDTLFQNCVTFCDEYKNSEVPNIRLSALCAIQVITTIQTEQAVAYIASNIESILVLCASEEPLVRSAAYAVLQWTITNKPTVLCTEQHFTTVLQAVRFGLNSDMRTAKNALSVFTSLCERFDPKGNDPFLVANYDLIMEILTGAQQRPDAFIGLFIEDVSDAIFIFIQYLPQQAKVVINHLIEYLKTVIDHFIRCTGENYEERQKLSDLYIIVGIIQVLKDQITPFGDFLLSTLIQSLTNNNENDKNSINFNIADSIIMVISQIVHYIGSAAMPFFNQIVRIAENAQTSDSPQMIIKSADLIGCIISEMGKDLVSLVDAAAIVQRLFNLVYTNAEKITTLPSSVSYLLFALANIIKGVAASSPENAQQFVSPLMNISVKYVKNLEFYVNSDFDAANLIAEALMNAFIVIIETFPTETQFISVNLKPVFIQVPIVVWTYKMLTRRTVENFLILMHRLIRNVGRKNNIELNNQNLRDFLVYANSTDSPYDDLKPLATTVWKFYSDI